MEYVFFGTPQFAGIILQGLIDAGMPPLALVCNSDKPFGRKKLIMPPLTKQIAQKHGIKVFQPETKGDLISLSPALSDEAQLGVVAAYGKIIPQGVIGSFELGIIGVHPSLLPKFRGPSPIQSAILSGDSKIGTTLFMLTKGIDDGPILCQKEEEINGKSYEELVEDLGKSSLGLLINALSDFNSMRTKVMPQDEDKATFTSFFKNDAGLVNEDDLEGALNGDEEKSLEIERMVRALNPEPGVYAFINGKRTKILSAHKDGNRLVLERIQKDGKTPEIST